MIEVRQLTKSYGAVTAVKALSFDVQPGQVTAFLGPNGAGKSTTMRMILGLDRPTSGTALIAGQPFASLSEPMRHVGALLEPGAIHPGRTGRNHLRVAASSNGISARRVEEAIDQVGLTSVAGRRIKGYSLGMRQRLGIAAALLGEPHTLIFDEPVNGLDLDGVRWIRGLFRNLADQGRTVLVSSHMMSEVQLTADRILVIGRGRLLADTTTEDMLRDTGKTRVRVTSQDNQALSAALRDRGFTLTATDGPDLLVDNASAEAIGVLAHSLDLPLRHLSLVEQSLEDAYLQLTHDSVEHLSSQITRRDYEEFNV